MDPPAPLPPPEPPPSPFRNQPGLPRHRISSSSVPRPAASTTHISVAMTDGDTGAVPPVLPRPKYLREHRCRSKRLSHHDVIQLRSTAACASHARLRPSRRCRRSPASRRKAPGHPSPGHDTGQKFVRAWPLAHVRDHLVQRSRPIASFLESVIDHESPQVVLPLGRLVVQHHEADRRVICVNGPEPRDVAIEVRLRYRDGVGGDEALLLWRDFQLEDVAQVLFGDFPEECVRSP